MLSMVSLSGMIVLMVIIVWQMHGNIMNERRQLIYTQVVTATELTDSIFTEFQRGDISEWDAKRKVLTYLASMKYPDSGYFWVMTDEGMMLMHPHDQQLIGRNLFDLQDSQGKYFVREQVTAAHAGGGYVIYDWPKPQGGDPVTKIAYIDLFKPWNWVIGSGLYVDDLRQAARKQIALGGALILFLFVINIAVSLFLSRRYLKHLRHSAIHDSLTGLHTRGYLEEVSSKLLDQAQLNARRELVAIFFDIDHFKQVNDRYGHEAGDIVLRNVGQIIKHNSRPEEIPFRYGGEEFALTVFASEEAGRRIAERLRQAVNEYTFNFSGEDLNITLSAGVAVGSPGEPLEEILQRADECMYAAKEKGRDCVVTESKMG
jgi:methyl-accepting chemotaxis protein